MCWSCGRLRDRWNCVGDFVTVAVPKLPFSVPFWNKNCGFWNIIHIINLKVKISNIFIRFLVRIPRERRVLFQISLKVFQKGTKINDFGTSGINGHNKSRGMKMLFDSHAHINNDTFTEEEREALIADIEASDLSYVMDIGFDLPSSEQAVKDAQRLTWCYAAVGVHPHDTKTMDEDVLSRIRELAGEEKVKAIGEIGLDF